MKKNSLRVVIDTNIIISSFWGGNPEKIITLLKKSAFTYLLSNEILIEITRVLIRTFGNCFEVNEMIDLLAEKAERISSTISINAIPDDPSDNKFIECAVAGKADFIISGDKHLLNLKSFQNIPILTPKQFLEQFQ